MTSGDIGIPDFDLVTTLPEFPALDIKPLQPVVRSFSFSEEENIRMQLEGIKHALIDTHDSLTRIAEAWNQLGDLMADLRTMVELNDLLSQGQ